MDEARVWANLKVLALELGDIAKAMQAYETKTGHKPKAIGLHPQNAGGIKHRPGPKRGRPATKRLHMIRTSSFVRNPPKKGNFIRLALCRGGLSIRGIAGRLGLSRSTVHRTLREARTPR